MRPHEHTAGAGEADPGPIYVTDSESASRNWRVAFLSAMNRLFDGGFEAARRFVPVCVRSTLTIPSRSYVEPIATAENPI